MESTNDFLKDKVREGKVASPYCVSAAIQTKGRGQRGKTWQSAPYVNVVASFLVQQGELVENLANVNPLVAYSLYQTLVNHGMRDVKIKWPNDIYVSDKKIAGILVEPIWEGNRVKHIIIGTGVNVNQIKFEGINGTSMLLETNRPQEVSSVLTEIYKSLYTNIQSKEIDFLSEVNKVLLKKNESVTFMENERLVEYTVLKIQSNGNLLVTRDGVYKELQHHNVKWII